MYESGVNSEEPVNYNLLFCHACLSSNRTLTPVGDYINIYLKICDNSRMNLTSQVNVCWECLALLRKVQAFRRKVENAQKILDYCVRQQTPLEDNLSNLTLSSIETTTFDFPVIDEENDYENYLENNIKTTEYSDLDKSLRTELYTDKSDLRHEDSYNELMFKIEDVRGQCDILHVPMLDLSASSGEVKVKIEHLDSPEGEEERQHRRWQRSAMLVYKRICSHRYAQHFLRPVTDDLAPLYSRIIRRPTDLSTIRRRIKDGVIRTTAEFTRALLLMFSNALMYNSSHHFIYQMTLEFREETLRELSLLMSAEEEAGAECPLARLLRRPAPLPPPTAPPPRLKHVHARRRASVLDPPQHEHIKPPAAPRARRASVYEAPPAAPRTRRASVYEPADPKPTEPRKRTKWDWPSIEDEYLIAKKYKNSVAVLL
ncbi:bromodomain-containing protein 4-like [Cydia splendana]|uniref:bromodomain-containing protein 4-like n=1 Tax=Cydia splendana TaxID=1100963 RepID=UPI00300CFFC8